MEDRTLELLHAGQVGIFESRHRENPLEKAVLAGPGLLDTELFALVLAALHGEVAKGMVEVPRHELEPIGLRMQVHHVILTEGKNGIEGAEPHSHRHETTEGLDIEELWGSTSEVRIAGLGDESGEVDDPLLLFCRQLGLGVVDLLIGLPIVPQVLKQGRCHRLENGAFLGAKMPVRPAVVRIFDDGIQTKIVVGMGSRCRNPDPRISRARGWNSSIAIQGVRQRFIHPRGVGDVVVEVDLGHAGKLLVGDELVEIELE